MAKIKCNHCRAKFIYKSKSSLNSTVSSRAIDRHTLLSRYNIKNIEGKHYCSVCLDTIGKYTLKEEKPGKKEDRNA